MTKSKKNSAINANNAEKVREFYNQNTENFIEVFVINRKNKMKSLW